MTAPPEVIAAFDAVLPGHSGVEDWFWVSRPGVEHHASRSALDVYVRQIESGWEASAHLPAIIGGQAHSVHSDLDTAIRSAVRDAARMLLRYAGKQERAAARRLDRAAEAKALAAQWVGR